MIDFIIGGARSGKSLLAEQRASATHLSVTYLATGYAGDSEMAQRIAHHRARRPAHWTIVEEQLQLAAALQQHAASDRCMIVDCVTLWLTNLLCAGRTVQHDAENAPIDTALMNIETTTLLAALPHLPGHIILVSNEVGSGIVPLGPLNRIFADEQGRLNQQIARIANHVTLVAAGLPLELKSPA